MLDEDYKAWEKEKGVAYSLGVAVIAGMIITAPLQFLPATTMVYWMMGILVIGSLLVFWKDQALSKHQLTEEMIRRLIDFPTGKNRSPGPRGRSHGLLR